MPSYYVLRAARTAVLLLGVALGTAPALAAQSGPGAAGTRAKNAARNAAAKTNAHTNAVQGGGAAQGAQPPSAPPEVPASAGRGSSLGGSQRGDDASVSVKGGKDEVAFRREAFSYERSARRDPFLSLLHSHDLRPMINDLKLVAVLYDPVGRSWAVMRDMTTKEQYRVKVGQQLGRMRVIQIHPKSVTFTIEEIGFSRQQTLALNDSQERKP
jgi:hypothetical protein